LAISFSSSPTAAAAAADAAARSSRCIFYRPRQPAPSRS
jgi:hypothetical protein